MAMPGFGKKKKEDPISEAPAMAMAEPESEPGPVEAMATFIAAVKAGDASAAHSAFESYKELCEYEEPMMEEPRSSFSG